MGCFKISRRSSTEYRPYQPYEGKIHPRFANVNDCQEKSPLESRLSYYQHIGLTRRILNGIQRRRNVMGGGLLLSNIQKKEWFIRIEERLEEYVKVMESSILQGQRKIVGEAVMEFYCSLIIFSDHAYYWRMTEEDVLSMRIPLSKQTRLVLCRGFVARKKRREGNENEEEDDSRREQDALRFSLFPY